MDGRVTKDCYFESRVYSQGAELCDSAGCLRCKDGEWVERIEDLVSTFGP